jgi:hypothetical protein
MPNPTRFPSALHRRYDSGPGETPRKTGPTPKQIAEMDAETYKRYAQSRGEWTEPDLEVIAEARRQNHYIGR